MQDSDLRGLAGQVLAVAQGAGRAILDIYHAGPTEVTHKADDSPVTAADLAAHRCIVEGLLAIDAHIPIVSEEGLVGAVAAVGRPLFWLVDPLDGTKEFLARNGEFTVNIALIAEGRPVLGVVDVPVQGLSYWGALGHGAFKCEAGHVWPIQVAGSRQLGRPLRVMASRRHLNAATQIWLDRWGELELVQAGSSLKFCHIAEGTADVYPRLAPTCEWDTAAAQAVVEAAGGHVCQLDGSPLRYGKADVINPHFIVSGLPLSELGVPS